MQLIYILVSLSNKSKFKENYEHFCKCQDIYSMKTFITYELKQINRLNPKKKVILTELEYDEELDTDDDAFINDDEENDLSYYIWSFNGGKFDYLFFID